MSTLSSKIADEVKGLEKVKEQLGKMVQNLGEMSMATTNAIEIANYMAKIYAKTPLPII